MTGILLARLGTHCYNTDVCVTDRNGRYRGPQGEWVPVP